MLPGTSVSADSAGTSVSWEGSPYDCGVPALFVPIVIVAALSLRFFKLDFGQVAGILCGSMANPMALNYANDSIPGDHPAVAYATVYPVCMFLRVIIIQILIMCFI